jgi:hypothetical protein
VHPSQTVGWHRLDELGFEHILDGTSNTALASERLIQTASNRTEFRSADPRIKSLHILNREEDLGQIVQQMNSSHTHAFESAHIGRSWSSGSPLVAPTYMHVQKPNSVIGHYSSSMTEGDFVMTPSSQHTGGVNMSLVDGSIQFISNNVSNEVWWAFGSRNDGRTERN